MAKREINVPVSVPVYITGEQQIAKLESQLHASQEEADRLRNSLWQTQSALQQVEEELDRLKTNSGIAILETELERFRETAEQSVREVRSYLQSVNLSDFWDNDAANFSEIFRKVSEGSITAQQAILRIKKDYSELLTEFSQTNGAFDMQMVQQFTLAMENLGTKMDEVLDRIYRIETEGVRTIGEGISSAAGGSGGGFNDLSEMMDKVRQMAENMSEAANGSITSITNMVEALKGYAEIDGTKLIGVAQAFRNMADLGTGSFGTKSVENLVYLAKQMAALNESGNFNFRFDVSGLKDFKVSTTIHHLSDFLNSINDTQIASLERLSKVNLSNFSQDNLKIKKETADSVKALMEQNDAMSQAAKAAEEDKAGMEAAAKAEQDKAKIADLLAQALAKEEEATKKAGDAAKEDADKEQAAIDKRNVALTNIANTLRSVETGYATLRKLDPTATTGLSKYEDLARSLRALYQSGKPTDELVSGLKDLKHQYAVTMEQANVFSIVTKRIQAAENEATRETEHRKSAIESLLKLYASSDIQLEKLYGSRSIGEVQSYLQIKESIKEIIAADNEAEMSAEDLQNKYKDLNGTFIAAKATTGELVNDKKRLAEAEREVQQAQKQAQAQAQREAIKAETEAYKDAKDAVQQYHKARMDVLRDANARSDLVLGENGWESTSGAFQVTADNLNSLKTKYDMVTDAQSKNALSAEHLKDINKLLTDTTVQYNLACEKLNVKEEQAAKKKEEAARKAEEAAEAARKEKEQREALARQKELEAQADASLKESQRQQAEAAKQTTEKYKEMFRALQEIGKYRLEKNKGIFDGNDPIVQNAEKELQKYIARYRELRQELNAKLDPSQLRALHAELIKQKEDLDKLTASQASKQIKTDAAKAQTAETQRQKAAQEQLNQKYEETLRTLKALGKARADQQKYSTDRDSENYKNATAKVEEYLEKYKKLRAELGADINVAQHKELTEEIRRQTQAYKDRKAAMQNDATAENQKAAESVEALNQRYEALNEKTAEVTQKMDALRQAQQALANTKPGTDERKQAMEAYSTALRDATDAVKAQADVEKEQEALNGKRTGMLQQLNAMLVQCEDAQKRYAAAARLGLASEDYSKLGPYISYIRQMIDALEAGAPITAKAAAGFDKLKASISSTMASLKTGGSAIGTWVTNDMQQLKSRLTYTFSLAAMVYKAINEVKKMVSTAVELDTAMNNLQIVTRSSGEEMEKYAKRVSDMAKETSQATKDLIDATTVYARLGYTLDESAILSKYTAMLQGVGDIEASAAQDAMTAIIKAFDKDVNDVEDVMNKMVVVGNNFPISVSQIAEGMNNAGSMLAVAGNSLEESIALLTAANTTVQNISKASTGLRTIAARIRKMKTEDGEIVEESKYNEMIDALTEHNVALVDANGEYRKTYDIIKDIAAVWKDLSSMQQSAVVEALAGTRQQNIFASLMTQFGEAEDAIVRMRDSEGELQEAYDIYKTSIQAHVNTMKAAYAELSRDFVDSDLAKNTIDFLTKIIEGLDTLISDLGVLGTVLTAVGSTGLIQSVMSGSLAVGFSGIAKALGAIVTAVPELLVLAAAIAAVTFAVKKYKEAHPSTEDLKNQANATRQTATEAEQAYKSTEEAIEKNKEKIKELQKLATNGKITREQRDELDYLKDQNETYERQLEILERKAELAKEAADNAQREAANAQFSDLFNDNPEKKWYERIRWPWSKNKTIGDADIVLGRQHDDGNINEQVDALISSYEYYSLLSDNIRNNIAEGTVETTQGAIDELDKAEQDMADTANALRNLYVTLSNARAMYDGLVDEESLAHVAEIDEILDRISTALPKTDKSLAAFKHNFHLLSDEIRKNLAKGLDDLTDRELRDFNRWLKDCNYTLDEVIDNLDDWVKEMDGTPDGLLNTTSRTIGDLTSLRDELSLTKIALEEYKNAMEGGEKGDSAKEMADIYKGALEDIKSGRIDTYRVHNAAELILGEQRLKELNYNLDDIAEELSSDFLQTLFDPSEESKKSYGQRFAQLIQENAEKFAEAGVSAEKTVDGFRFHYDSFEKLAEALGMSEAACAAFLEDLDAYGNEVMRSTEENDLLIADFKRLQAAAEQVGGSGDAIGDFAKSLAEAGRDSIEIWSILKDLREDGLLEASDEELAGAISRAKEAIKQEAEEEAKASIIDAEAEIDNIKQIRDAFKKEWKDPTHTQVVVDFTDSDGTPIKNLRSALIGQDDESDQFGENVMQAEYIPLSQDDLNELHRLFRDMADESGDARDATKALVDALRLNGMGDDQINRIISIFNAMGDSIPTLEEIDRDAQNVASSLENLNDVKVNPTIDVNTSPAYRAMNSLLASFDSLSRRTYMVNVGVNSFGTASTRAGAYQNYTGKSGSGAARADGGRVGIAGETLVNELGPELISDHGRAFIANKGQPGFVYLSKDAIVFNAEDTKDILKKGSGLPKRAFADGTRKGLIGRLLGGRDVPAKANQWKCKACGSYNDASAKVCWKCKVPKGMSKTTAVAQGTSTKTTSTKSTTSTLSSFLNQNLDTAKQTSKDYVAQKKATNTWECPVCGYINNYTRTECAGCGYSRVKKNTVTVTKKLGTTSSYPAYQSWNDNDLFSFGDDGSGGGGGADSQSQSNPQKIDWIAVKLNRIQRAVSDLEKVASSGLKKLTTRIDAARDEAEKLEEEIDTAQRGYDRYIQEAESVGLSSDLAEKVRNGTIDIEEFEDEEIRQQISEYQEWYEKALDCASAVEELNQQIGELYKTNFDLVQADYSNQLALIEHEMNMINADMSMAQAKGMLDSAAYYERLTDQETRNIAKLKQELSDLNKYFNEAMSSGKIAEQSEEWYAMKQEILGVEEAIAEANVQLQEYAKTIREIKWSYFDYAQDRFGQLAQEASFLVELMSNDKLFQDNGQFNSTGLATVGMRATDYDAYMAQADAYAKELRTIQAELANNPYDTDLIARRETLLQLQQQSILAAEQEKNAVKSLVEEGIQLELSSLRDLIDAYKDSLDSAKDLYEYQKKITEKTADVASIQKQLAAYQGDTSEETRAKVQKLNKDLEKAQKDLAETEYEQNISDQKKLLDDIYDEYEELLNGRLDDVDALMKEMIDTANANAGTIREEIANVADKVGYTITSELSTAMGSYANYDRMFEGIAGANNVLNQIYDNVNAMARAAGAVKAYAKGGIVDYTGLAMVHGSPGNPEMVLSAADTAKFLEAAQMMQVLPNMASMNAKDIGAMMSGSGGGTSIGEIVANISIDHVQDYNDFVTQLQQDPKFEKLIDTMTMGRMLGGSRLSKNSVRF